MSKKHDPEFEAFVREVTTLDSETGTLSFDNAYVYLGVNYNWKSTTISPNYANVVWFMTHGRWPKPGYVIDHINDNPLDNRPCNLQEITQAENQAKRRGRKVYRNYGSGKYGYGLHILHDKRDDRFYVTRTMSRGHGKGDLKGIKLSLGGFDTLIEAEARVDKLSSEIEANGLDYVPPQAIKNPKKQTAEMNAAIEEMRKLRAQGYSVKAIAEMLDFDTIAVYNRIKDMDVDNRRGAAHGGVKLTEEKVHQIRQKVAAGERQSVLADECGVSRAMVSQIVKRQAWGWVK